MIQIDATTGKGTSLELSKIALSISGLAWDPARRLLYASSVSTTGSPSLHIIDLSSERVSLIGTIGQEIHGLAWIEPFGLIGVWDRVYLINENTGAPLPLVTGPEFRVDSGFGVFGLAGKGSLTLPHNPPTAMGPNPLFPDTKVSIAGDKVNVSWEAKVNTFYEIGYSSNLRHWNWDIIDQFSVGEEGRGVCGGSFFLPPGGTGPVEIEHDYNPNVRQGFYRIRATEFEATATNDPARIAFAVVLGLGILGLGKWRQALRS